MLRASLTAGLAGLSLAFIVSCASSSKSNETSKWDGKIQDYEAAPLENPPAAPTAFFDWPVDKARFVRGFALKPSGKRKKPHLGLDLASFKNAPIFSAQDGTVIYVGRDFRGYGQMILIEGKSNWATLYAHLNKSHVKAGDIVKRGQKIGLMGKTGRATGVHLHFEIRKDRGAVDPLLYLPQSKVALRLPAKADADIDE